MGVSFWKWVESFDWRFDVNCWSGRLLLLLLGGRWRRDEGRDERGKWSLMSNGGRR